MAGLAMTEESLQEQVRALVAEEKGYEARARAAQTDEEREKWESRVEQVREQLRARGSEAAPPHRRANRREGKPGQETR